MENTFEQDVSESLKLLWARLNRKVKQLQPVDYGICSPYVSLLKKVAENPQKYCKPGKNFVKKTKNLSFYTGSKYSLFKLDQKVAECVYDIMLCMHDYIFYTNEKFYKTSKCSSRKYKSVQEAIDAMRLFKRDSIQMTGGIVPYLVRNLFNKNR